LTWVRRLQIRDLRNIQSVAVDLDPGLNVFFGRNAQGKTSVLEAFGVVARGRSFRTENAATMIRRGATSLLAAGRTGEDADPRRLEVEIEGPRRTFRVDGRVVPPREYHGRLEVVVYSTDRLRVVRGPMRERRLFLDRSAAALWPAYRQEMREFERILAQRNAALDRRGRDLDVWTERFVASGSRLRRRRAAYAERLNAALATGFRPQGETYEICPHDPAAPEEESRRRLALELSGLAERERASGRTLAGPQRDPVAVLVNGQDASDGASSGQARSFLLAMALASLRVYHDETGRSAVALLDDLDSELDEERAGTLCAEVARRGQALVTSAHPRFAHSLRTLGRLHQVADGEVRCA
jgi:DNA replication and repair protein RecF